MAAADPLLAILAPVLAAAGARVRRDDDDEVTRLVALDAVFGAAALPIALHPDASIELATWIHPVDPDDPDDLLDLVAAALLGRIRVRLARDDRGPQTREVDWVGPDGATVAIDRMARPRWPWQRRVALVEHRNAVVLQGLSLGTGGRLPRAPWSGTLAITASDQPQPLAIDGELDLHNFPPREVGRVVEAYIDACLERGVVHLRIVHGKGIGELRRTVHAILARHPAVASHRLGGHGEGSWGATMVTLHPPKPDRD